MKRFYILLELCMFPCIFFLDYPSCPGMLGGNGEGTTHAETKTKHWKILILKSQPQYPRHINASSVAQHRSLN